MFVECYTEQFLETIPLILLDSLINSLLLSYGWLDEYQALEDVGYLTRFGFCFGFFFSFMWPLIAIG